MEQQTYEVTCRFQYPAWDEKEGITITVAANSKSEAIRRARTRFYNDGHTVGRRAYLSAELQVRK